MLLKLCLNRIPTGHGLNQPIYSYQVTQAGRNRVNPRKSGCLSFSGALVSHRLSELSTNHLGAFPICTLHFDVLKFWQADASVLLKNLQS